MIKTYPFLNKHCRSLMVRYYKRKHWRKMLKVLQLFKDYGPLDYLDVIDILSLEDGWDKNDAVKAFAMCVYCGFLDSTK